MAKQPCQLKEKSDRNVSMPVRPGSQVCSVVFVCKYTTFAFFIFMKFLPFGNEMEFMLLKAVFSSEMRVKLAMIWLPFATNSSQWCYFTLFSFFISLLESLTFIMFSETECVHGSFIFPAVNLMLFFCFVWTTYGCVKSRLDMIETVSAHPSQNAFPLQL